MWELEGGERAYGIVYDSLHWDQDLEGVGHGDGDGIGGKGDCERCWYFD